MVVVSILPLEGFGPNDHREIALHFNSQVSKKLIPQVLSWFSRTKGIDCEEITHDKANLTSSGDSSCLETFDANRKYYFRLSLPVNSTFKISFPV